MANEENLIPITERAKSEQRAILKRNDIEPSREGVKQVGLVSQRIRNTLKLKDENVVLTSERAVHIVKGKPLEDGRYPVIVIAKGVSKRKDITNSIISARIIREQDYKRYIENEVNKHELLFSE